jgi:hypothetical protein
MNVDQMSVGKMVFGEKRWKPKVHQNKKMELLIKKVSLNFKAG